MRLKIEQRDSYINSQQNQEMEMKDQQVIELTIFGLISRDDNYSSGGNNWAILPVDFNILWKDVIIWFRWKDELDDRRVERMDEFIGCEDYRFETVETVVCLLIVRR